ncbi:MAG: hypothetical protein V4635_04665 [Bacteroidota bacterium]
MKHLLPAILIFLWPAGLFSQKKYFKWEIKKHHARVRESRNKGTILLSLDTIFNKGIPYAILKEKKQMPYNSYGLYSLNNNKLILIQTRISVNSDQTPYYAFMFVGSDKTAEAEKHYGFSIENEIVKSDLVINNQIDPFNETMFLVKFPGKFSDPSIKTYINEHDEGQKVNTDNIYETVKRNRESEFFFKEGKIIQDYKIIGRYKTIDTAIRFYLPNGIQVAEAKEKGTGLWQVFTLKDRKNGDLKTSGNNFTKELVGYLLDNDYL